MQHITRIEFWDSLCTFTDKSHNGTYLHRQCQVQQHLWRDDLSQATKGSTEQVKRNLIKCLVSTAQGLQSQGRKIASKWVIMNSHAGDATGIVGALRLRGTRSTAARHTA